MSDYQSSGGGEFRKVMGQFATGVALVSTWDSAGRAYGLTVNAFTSVSLQPMLVLICLENSVAALEALRKRRTFGLCMLTEEQEEISNHYATKMTDRTQYLTRVGETGVPLLEESLASLECQVSEFYPGGDHVIVLAEVKAMEMAGAKSGKRPLLFFQGKYRRIPEALS